MPVVPESEEPKSKYGWLKRGGLCLKCGRAAKLWFRWAAGTRQNRQNADAPNRFAEIQPLFIKKDLAIPAKDLLKGARRYWV
jgi:hypothetical protein